MASSPFEDVVGLGVVHGTWLGDTTLVVIPADGACFFLLLGVEENGDDRFIESLERRTDLSAELAETMALDVRCAAFGPSLA